MKASYISYFEGYNADGNVIFNGNGSCWVECDESGFIDADGLNTAHNNHLLGVAKEKDNRVVRVVIKNMMRL